MVAAHVSVHELALLISKIARTTFMIAAPTLVIRVQIRRCSHKWVLLPYIIPTSDKNGKVRKQAPTSPCLRVQNTNTRCNVRARPLGCFNPAGEDEAQHPSLFVLYIFSYHKSVYIFKTSFTRSDVWASSAF